LIDEDRNPEKVKYSISICHLSCFEKRKKLAFQYENHQCRLQFLILHFRVKYCVSPNELLSKASIPDGLVYDYQGTTSPINIPTKSKTANSTSSEYHSAPTRRQGNGEFNQDSAVPRSVPVSIPKPGYAQDKWTKIGIDGSGVLGTEDDIDDFHIETPASSSFQSSKRDGMLKLSISPFRDSGLHQSKSASPVMPVLSSSPSNLPLVHAANVGDELPGSIQTFRQFVDNPHAHQLDIMSTTANFTDMMELFGDVNDS